MRFYPVSLDTFLVEFDTLDETLVHYNTLQTAALLGITELVPAARTIMVSFAPWQTTAQELMTTLSVLPVRDDRRHQVPRVTIPVRYDGEDLATLAETLGISVAALTEQHQTLIWKVAFTGFAPGFAYMVCADWPWQVPRKATPRTRIPPGSLALAGEFSGIYPKASPGGWQLIGSTDVPMWDSSRQPPALLQPGSEVQFVPAEKKRLISLPAADTVADTQRSDPVLTVLSPGLLSTFQDAGRQGQAAMGVSQSGAMDKLAWHEANTLVGNNATRPALEITCGGLRIKAEQDIVVAITGAVCPMTLQGDGLKKPVEMNRPVALQAGDVLQLGSPRSGVRSYLALRGGFDTQPELQSASFDTLAQIGPPPLRAGDRLYLGQTPAPSSTTDNVTPRTLPAEGDTVWLDIIAGPRTDWFEDGAITHLTSQAWCVTPQSNRIGLRLEGKRPLLRCQHQELPSEGTCTGAIQVPASGQPVLFLNDHPLTGGYPVIAAVAPYHLDLAGQIPPGCVVRFTLVRPFTFLQEPTKNEP